jgi:hypothetical protein
MADEVGMKEHTKELSFTPWLAKINERVRLALECMMLKQDKIQESDYEILRALHGIWFYGEAPIYQTFLIPDTAKSSTQPSLFDDKNVNTTDNTAEQCDKTDIGTKVDLSKAEPKKKKK